MFSIKAQVVYLRFPFLASNASHMNQSVCVFLVLFYDLAPMVFS